jgi:homoserine kinase
VAKQLKNESMPLWKRTPFRTVLILFLLTIATPLSARTRAAAASAAVDQEYVAALATANRFLQAWQTQDPESGILLLSDKVKQHTREERLQSFFSRAENAQQAYEISGGKRLKAGRYIFSVALFDSRNGTSTVRRLSQVIVTRMAKNDWVIDKLP